MERKDRIKKAFKHLVFNDIVKSQAELADKMGINKASVSLAMNGDERYTTDNFMRNLCATFPNIFNLQWLLREEGDMLVETSQPKQPMPEYDLIDLAASLIKEVEALRLSLSEEIKQTIALRQELTEAIRDIRMTAAISNGTLTSQYLAEGQPSNDSSNFATPASQPYHVKSKKSV